MSTPSPDDPTRSRSRPRRSEVRSQLLEAAATVFARQGIDGASLDDVAAAAGYTKGAVYSNFGSKGGLIDALVGERTSAYLDVGLDAVDVDGLSVDDKAHLLGDALTRAGDEQRDWHLLFFELWQREVRAGNPADGVLAAARDGLKARVTDAVEQHVPRDGRHALSAQELATVLLALANGLAVERLISPHDVPDDLMGRVLAALVRPPA